MGLHRVGHNWSNLAFSIDTETPIRWTKLTMRWADYSHDISCYNPKNWPKDVGTNWSLKWRLSTLKTIKMALIRPPRTKFKMIVRVDCAVSAFRSLPQPIKSLAHSLSVVVVELLLDRSSPFPQVAGIQNRANFPFHQSGSLIGFWVVSNWTPSLVTKP